MPGTPRTAAIQGSIWIALLVVWSALACAPVVVTQRRSTHAPQPTRQLPIFDADLAAASFGVLPVGPLAVRDVAPEGPGTGEGIRLRLDRAVVDPAKPPADVRLVLDALAPDGTRRPIAARSVWTRGDVLSLIPEAELPAATAFEVRLQGRIADAHGAVVEGTTWRFETARPTFALIETDVLEHSTIWITPSIPVDPTVFAAHLRVAPAGATNRGGPLATRVRLATPRERQEHSLDPATIAIAPRHAWPAGGTLRVELDGELTAQAGPLPIATPWRREIAVVPAFEIGEPNCGTACELGPIEVPIGTGIAYESFAGIHVVPEPPGLSIYAAEPVEGLPERLTIDAEWSAGLRYDIVFDRDVFDHYGRRIRGPRRVTVQMGRTQRARDASIVLSSSTGIFASPEDARIGVLTEGVAEVRVRIAALRAQDAVDLAVGSDPDALRWPTTDRDTVTDHVVSGGRVILDLAKHAGRGDVVMLEAKIVRRTPRARPPEVSTVRGVFAISGLGVVVHRGPREGFLRVTAIDTGAPIADAEARSIGAAARTQVTDRDGLLRIAGAGVERERPRWLVTHGDDAIVVTAAPQPTLSATDRRGGRITTAGTLAIRPRGRARAGVRRAELREGELPSVEIFTGRALYQPGDAIHLAGWAGISTPHQSTAMRRIPPGTPVHIALQRGDDVIERRTVRVDRHGRFTATMRLAEAAKLEMHEITATVLGTRARASFVVAMPRIPTFELDVGVDADVVLRGTPIAITTHARYLNGEAATLSDARTQALCMPTSPNAMPELPYPFEVASDTEVRPRAFHPSMHVDGSSASAELATADLDHRSAHACQIAVAAADAGLQEVGGDTLTLVHPARAYLASHAIADAAGRRRTLEMIAVDWVGGRVALSGIHVEVSRVEGEVHTPVVRCKLDVEAAGLPGACRTPRLRAGRYQVLATAKVDGAPIEQRTHFMIDPPPPRERTVPPVVPAPVPEIDHPRPFEIAVADSAPPGKPTFAEITGPWDDARGVLAVEQIGLREVVPFQLVKGHARVRVPVAPDLGPGLELVARVAEPGGEAVTSTSMAVDNDRALDVRVLAPERARIGTKARVRIVVEDSAKSPVDARLAVWVVDDGIHQLRTAFVPNLHATFDPDRRHERGVSRTYDALLEPFWGFARRVSHAPSIRSASGNVSDVAVEPRRRFDSAPLFVGNVGTGPDGEHVVVLPLPDDLTRFRVTVIASASLPGRPESGPARFGYGSASIETTTPLDVRMAMPRAMRPGDRSSVAALVTLPHRGEVEVSLELDDPELRAVGPTRTRVRGEAGTTVRVPFVVRALRQGSPRARLRAEFHPEDARAPVRGAVEQRLAIAPERTQGDAVAIYGSLDDGHTWSLPIRLPAAALPDSGVVEVHASSSTLGELHDAAAFLADYPYGCAEQTASRLVPLVALGALHDRGAPTHAAKAAAAEAIAHLFAMQRGDGSFGYWAADGAVHPFAGAYATWILQLAHDAGLAVPERGLARARAAMVALVDGAASTAADADDRLAAVLALQVLAMAGETKPTSFDRVWRDRGTLSASGRMLLAMAMHRADPDDARLPELVRGLHAMLEERTAVAHIVSTTAAAAHWDSPGRDDAIGLLALLQLSPDDPRIDKLARGLAAQRSRGRWRTTQENAFALLALSRYAGAREAVVPDHHVQAWIGDRPVLDAEVRGFDATQRGGAVGLDALRTGRTDVTQVVLRRRGEGRVHWRVGVRWTEADPKPRAQGLGLTAQLLDADGHAVTQLVAGQRYRMRIVLDSDTPQQHIAVEVPLPAGVDAIDPTLGHGVAARALDTIGSRHLSHAELRPDRALLFFDALEPGATVHEIAVLATAPGSYALPGVVAEAMYEPETRARTSATRIEIVPR